jgi:hypothetical protein
MKLRIRWIWDCSNNACGLVRTVVRTVLDDQLSRLAGAFNRSITLLPKTKYFVYTIRLIRPETLKKSMIEDIDHEGFNGLMRRRPGFLYLLLQGTDW